MTFHDVPTDIPDPEVVPKAKRRKFSAEYKRRILEEADNCTESGQIGALLHQLTGLAASLNTRLLQAIHTLRDSTLDK